jgi:PAS domain S-box-containing protein
MKGKLDGGTLIAIGLVVALLSINAGFSYRNTRQLDFDAAWVAQTHEVLDLTSDVLLALLDAETAQRGFLVTGQKENLTPYQAGLASLEERLTALKAQTADNPRWQEAVKQLEAMSETELALLKQGIELKRKRATPRPLLDLAKKARQQMDAIRDLLADMRTKEQNLLMERQQQTTAAYHFAVITQLLATVVGLCVVGAFVWASQRTLRVRERAAAAIRQQQEWLRTTLTSIGDAVIATDAEGKITLLNSVAATLTGWSAEEAQEQPIQNVFKTVDEQTRMAADNPMDRVLQTGTIVGATSHTLLIGKDGRERPIDESAAPIKNQQGKIEGVVLVFRDVTERRQAEKDRKRTEETLKDADQKKNEFLAMLAHELRNPLAPISNALQIMRLTEGSGKSLAPVRDMMDRQVTQLVRLVDDLLDVSRITRGKLELRKARIDLAQVVEVALETTRPLMEAANHELTVGVPSDPFWVDGDLTRLGQVISNLLSNAAKYTPASGRIWLTVGRQGEQAILSVKDNGIGIAPDMLNQVFDMFTQVDHNVGRAQGGLGIGLTLVRRLIEMHGGTVEASSGGLGKGSEFIVRLPLIGAVTDSKPVMAANGDGNHVAAPRRRILVVDDNSDSADSLSLLLGIMGNDVQTALDGPSALDKAQTFLPELVLLDIGLPGMNGYEVARRLRLFPGLKDAILVAQTGWGQEEDRRRSAEAGFDAHLVKPVDQDALNKLVANLRT